MDESERKKVLFLFLFLSHIFEMGPTFMGPTFMGPIFIGPTFLGRVPLLWVLGPGSRVLGRGPSYILCRFMKLLKRKPLKIFGQK